MATAPIKVLVVGPVNGNIASFTSKVAKTHSKQKFDLALVAGGFFGDETKADELEKLLNNELKGSEICPNLTFLGNSGILSTSEGLKIGYLSGTSSLETDNKQNTDELENEESNHHYSTTSASSLLHHVYSEGNEGLDILLTYDWPQSVAQGSDGPGKNIGVGSEIVRDVAYKLKPRYHFAGSEGVWFERAPYKNGRGVHVTRFLGLGAVGNDQSERWYYAMNIVPLVKQPSTLSEIPPNSTVNPYHKKRLRGDDQNDDERKKRPRSDYVCKICNISGHFIQDCPQKGQTTSQRGPPDDYVCKSCNEKGHWIRECPKNEKSGEPLTCWFCLSNPQLAKHLIISIADEMYLSIAKGPLSDGHVLLVPITHFNTFHHIPPSSRDGVISDLRNYMSSLRSYFSSRDLLPVFFTVNRNVRYQHAHLQCVPIPLNLKESAKEQFSEAMQKEGWQVLNKKPQNGNVNYIRVDFGEDDEDILLVELERGVKFDLQFPRIVLANIFGNPELADWRTATSEEKESNMAETMKEAFKEFDFSLNATAAESAEEDSLEAVGQ
ncbi:CwfJ C-terminus 1-domain-containing protein-like protein [Paraphysoderma sedebokerense]|nr:CwfJ C-terminus 1-domain-containing protein-like protein [Paraphysoderma sedebokerense]